MNLDELKKKINKPTAFEWCGEPVWLRKIGANECAAIFATMKSLASRTFASAEDHQATIDVHANAIAKSLCDESGVLQFNTEEAVATLKEVNFTELVELGELVLRHSGFRGDEDAKKNSVTNNLPPIDSASNSELGPTPITSLNI
jgi:hypothetical protein